MKIILILLLCLSMFLIPAQCHANIDWSAKNFGIQNDKWFHVGAGFIVDQVVKQDKRISWIERKLIVAGVGTAKELSDPRFDFQDLGATVIGGFLCDLIVIRF